MKKLILFSLIFCLLGGQVNAETRPEAKTGLDADKLFDMVNNYRISLKLPVFQKDDRLCKLASARAPEIYHEIVTGTMHKGMYNRKLPFWNTENIIWMASEESAFTWWINDKIHHDAIVGPYTHSCLACSGNSCAQEFSSFVMK